jgi:carbamoyl-phosphate synthase large subunit
MSADPCNLLLTFAGLKGYLCPILRQAPACGAVVAVDADPLAPVQASADHFAVVPPASQPAAYVEALLEIVSRHDIGCIVPLNDLDLVVIAEARERFTDLGVRVLGVAQELAAILGDKLAAAEWLAAHDLPTCRTWELPPGETVVAEEPLVIKARRGQGSAGLRVLQPGDRLAEVTEGLVAQQLCPGHEYHLDVLCDGRGGVVAVVAKRKLAMHWGSTDRAVAVVDPQLTALGERLGRATAAVGSLDVDVMVGSKGPVILDVNPRLGGGFPFSAMFLPGYVEALVEICAGRRPPRITAPPDLGRVGCRTFGFVSVKRIS